MICITTSRNTAVQYDACSANQAYCFAVCQSTVSWKEHYFITNSHQLEICFSSKTESSKLREIIKEVVEFNMCSYFETWRKIEIAFDFYLFFLENSRI